MVYSSHLLGIILVLVAHCLAQQTGKKCPPVEGRSETCVCKSDKGIIDVTPLSKKDGTAM